MRQNIVNFLLCGATGWCMEILWTGLHSLLDGQKTLTGKTSLLMFPIYAAPPSSVPYIRGFLPFLFTAAEFFMLPDFTLWNSAAVPY